MTTVCATLNYFDARVPRGRFDLVDPARNLMPFEAHEVAIHDIRTAAQPPSIEREGFMLATHRSDYARRPEMLDTNLVTQDGLPPINRAYYEELQPLIEKISGAREVIPQATGLTVRLSPRASRQSWAAAADFIHVDVTDKSVGRFLDFSLAALGREIAPYRRFVLFQTWRAVSDPPQDNVLALVDRTSVQPADVALYDAILTAKGSMMESVEAASCRYSAGHRWSYASNMGAEDVLVFLGYDSDQPQAAQPFHTGFDIPGQEYAVPRASLEARFFAFYD
ncbi:MAG: hypothetical protein J7498_03630 [Sphingobium sp.]|nr:hypothetical protein [Sphingobium sp.]